MARIEWTQEAERAPFRLPVSARRDLLRTIDLLRRFPEMGLLVQEGRYRGHRRLTIGSYWFLYYRVVGPDRVVELKTLRHARRRPI